MNIWDLVSILSAAEGDAIAIRKGSNMTTKEQQPQPLSTADHRAIELGVCLVNATGRDIESESYTNLSGREISILEDAVTEAAYWINRTKRGDEPSVDEDRIRDAVRAAFVVE